MALETVQWESSTLLSCFSCPGAEVILCVDPNLVAPKPCPVSLVDQPFAYGLIEATLGLASRSRQVEPATWDYSFVFDDAQLIAPNTLTSADISGVFCKGCVSTWIEDLVGFESYVQDSGGFATLISEHGCEYLLSSTGGVGDLEHIFGAGSDGDLIVSNGEDVRLPVGRPYFFQNVTVEAGGTLRPVGTYNYFSCEGDEEEASCNGYYPIHVAGTLIVDGTISADGMDAPIAAGSQGTCSVGFTDFDGGNPGAQRALDGPGGGDMFGGCGGQGEGDHGAAKDGSSLISRPYIAGGFGGAGGDGGNGALGGDDASGSYTPGIFYKTPRYIHNLVSGSAFGSAIYEAIGGGEGGFGGGGGGRTGTAEGGMGGGGGAGAGCAYIAAKNVTIGVTGRISANGGNGADGADGTPGGGGDDAGGGGAGGGGGGGLVYLVYAFFDNSGTIESTGGVGGAGGAGVGGFANGENGASGMDGNVLLLDMCTGTFDSLGE